MRSQPARDCRAEPVPLAWAGAEVVAERVRAAVALAPEVVADRLVPVSVSIGAATRGDERSDTLVAKADGAMYAARATGRDSVCLAP